MTGAARRTGRRGTGTSGTGRRPAPSTGTRSTPRSRRCSASTSPRTSASSSPAAATPTVPVTVAVFGEEMVEDGYQDVVNIDISSVVIDQMTKKYHDKPQLKYIKMDVRDMSHFQSGSFDAVIDKGTLDSIMCGQNSQENATKMLEEVNRILTEKGVYIMITYGDPNYRLRLLKDMQHWTVKLHIIDRLERSSNQSKWELTKPLPLDEHSSTPLVELLGPKPDVHYIYVCVKGKYGARGDSKAGEAVN